MTARALRLGTRGSRLALWQAHTVANRLQAGGTGVEIIVIKTGGDRLQSRPLSEAVTKRLFVKEIEDALLHGDVDLAVHSAKDMPAVLPDGLEIAAALSREDPRDALVLPAGTTVGGDKDLASVLARIGGRPSIGTSSVRRVAQLASVIRGATFVPIRGNVDTRLRKLDDGEYDGLVLAAAGMRRLGVEDRISASLPFDVCVPAPGQGIIAVEIRSDDGATRPLVQRLHDAVSGAALIAERALVAALGGGCQLPLGGIAVGDGEELEMWAVVMSVDGARVVRAHGQGSVTDPEALGRRLAEDLAASGAADILEEVRRGQ
jgi:hydroxymethylbilane synthase